MGFMFNKCHNLKYLNLSNFTNKNNCITKNIFNKINHSKCKFITNNKTLKQLYI